MTEISHSLQEQIYLRARVYGKDTSRFLCAFCPFRPIMTWHMGRGCQRGKGGFILTSFPRAAPTSWNSPNYAANMAPRSQLGYITTVNASNRSSSFHVPRALSPTMPVDLGMGRRRRGQGQVDGCLCSKVDFCLIGLEGIVAVGSCYSIDHLNNEQPFKCHRGI